MAYERDSSRSYRAEPANNYEPASMQPRDAAQFDSELQVDPELAEGPASNSRIAIFAVAIAVVLGAVFYGLNNTSMEGTTTGSAPTSTAATKPNAASTNQNVAEQTKPPVAPGVRDVTPYNKEPGTTTGAAPAQQAQPSQPPAAQPTGTQVDRSASSPSKPGSDETK